MAFAAVGELTLAEAAGLGAFANADAEMGDVLIARSVAAHGAAQWSAYALGLGVVVALGLVGALAVRRGAASRGALVDTALALGCLLVAAALGLGSHARRTGIVAPLGNDASLDGVELVEMPPEARPGALLGHTVVVDADGVHWIGREGISFGDGHAALVERFRDTAWAQDVVLDVHADGEDLARALAAMQEAGIAEARIYGERSGTADAAAAPAVLAHFLESPAQVPLDVCDLDEDAPSERVGRITADGTLEVTERATGAAFDFDPYGYDRVEVTFDPRADAPSLVRGLARGMGRFSTQLAFCARPAS